MSGQIETNDLMPEPAPYRRTPNPQAGEVEQHGCSMCAELLKRYGKLAGADYYEAEHKAHIAELASGSKCLTCGGPLSGWIMGARVCKVGHMQRSYPKWATPAGEVEEQLSNILMALCARVERIPRGKTYGWSDEQKAIMALFIASQPPVVEGELDIREILDALVAREHGADNDMTVEKAEQLLAARQQSADEAYERGREFEVQVLTPVCDCITCKEVAMKQARLTQRGEGGGKA